MIQGLLEPVRDILDTLREVTGRDVQFVRKPDLKSLARIRMETAASSAHVLFYRDEADPFINHVIANECGHLIRLFGAEPAKRVVAVANERTMERYREEIRDDIQRLSLIHGLGAFQDFIPLWYESVVFQLTRMPPDIAVERWLHRQYPGLREIQRRALMEQQARAVAVLSRGIRRMTPRKVYDVTQAMNFAFFKLMGRLVEVDLCGPYERSLCVLEGGGLAKAAEEDRGDNHEGDVALTRVWAESLGLSGWIEWRGLGEVSAGTLH